MTYRFMTGAPIGLYLSSPIIMYLAALSESTWALIVGQAVVVIGLVLKTSYDMWTRIQDREDRKQLATLTLEQLDDIKKAGSEREKRLVSEVVKTRQVTIQGVKEVKKSQEEVKEFAKTANNINEKIERIGLERLEIEKNKVQDVHVVNPPSDPIPTKQAD